MAKVGDLFVQIGGNVSGLNAALGKAAGMLGSFASRVGSTALGTVLGSMISNGINTGIGDAIKAASNLNETVSKTEVLLGANADTAKAFASQMAAADVGEMTDTLNSVSSIVTAMTNLGTSTDVATKKAMALQMRFADIASQDNASIADTAKAFASQMAAAGVSGMTDTLNSVSSIVTAMTNLGTSTDVATIKAMALQMRFADIASQDNASIAEVQAAFQSLLAGQIEPLRRFNVFTNIDKLNKAGKPLGEAAFDVFMSQTQRAQGDFSRTSMSFANLSRAGDIRSGAVSEAVGNALQGAAQAFQLFRNGFLSQILAKVQDGTLAKAGESIFNAVVSIGTVLQSALPYLLDTTFGFIEGMSKAFGEVAIAISAAFKKPMDFIGLVLRSVADTLLSIAQYFEKILASIGLGSGNNIQALRDSLQAGMVDNQTALAEAGIPAVQAIEDTKKKLRSAINAPTLPGVGATGSTIAEASQSRSSAFASLLDGVMATAQEKQIAVLEQINAGIQTIANKGPQGAKQVTEKTTLATISTPQLAGAF